jgi:hypothetical protein
MTLHDLYRIERNVRPTLTTEQQDCAQELVNDQSRIGMMRFFLGKPEWMDSSVQERCLPQGLIPLLIDLRFPNRILLGQLGQLLQNLRNHPGGKPSQSARKTPNLGKWAGMGLLPCMDLLLWAEEEQKRLPDRLIADGLAAGDHRREDQIRRIVRPLAKGFLRINGSNADVEWTRLQVLAYSDALDREQVRRRLQARPSKRAI